MIRLECSLYRLAVCLDSMSFFSICKSTLSHCASVVFHIPQDYWRNVTHHHSIPLLSRGLDRLLTSYGSTLITTRATSQFTLPSKDFWSRNHLALTFFMAKSTKSMSGMSIFFIIISVLLLNVMCRGFAYNNKYHKCV